MLIIMAKKRIKKMTKKQRRKIFENMTDKEKEALFEDMIKNWFKKFEKKSR